MVAVAVHKSQVRAMEATVFVMAVPLIETAYLMELAPLANMSRIHATGRFAT